MAPGAGAGLAVWLCAAALLGGGCAGRGTPADLAPRARPVPYEQGIASWYGRGHHGKRTASGERFDMDALTAAHRRLAFGTRVEVVNLENGRSVVVRVNDRGPFVEGRVIDLSRAAARRLGFVEAGTVRVAIYLLE